MRVRVRARIKSARPAHLRRDDHRVAQQLAVGEIEHGKQRQRGGHRRQHLVRVGVRVGGEGEG